MSLAGFQILLLLTCIRCCSYPYKVCTVAHSMHTMGHLQVISLISTPAVPPIDFGRLSQSDVSSTAQRIVGQNSSKARWLGYQMQPDVEQHPGTFGILHFPYFLLGHTIYFSGILYSMVVWALERISQPSGIEHFHIDVMTQVSLITLIMGLLFVID